MQSRTFYASIYTLPHIIIYEEAVFKPDRLKTAFLLPHLLRPINLPLHFSFRQRCIALNRRMVGAGIGLHSGVYGVLCQATDDKALGIAIGKR